MKFQENGKRSKLALDTLDLPNGCAVVEIPTHVIKNRKYHFEFEARDRRKHGHERSVSDGLQWIPEKARHIREMPTLYIDNINHSCGLMK